MKILEFGRCPLSCCMAAAILVGCGGSQLPIGAQGTEDVGYSLPYHRTLHYTGKRQVFVVLCLPELRRLRLSR
jgi:hypothetical protein